MSASPTLFQQNAIDILQMKARIQRPFKLSPIKKLDNTRNQDSRKPSLHRSSSVVSIPHIKVTKKSSDSLNKISSTSLIEILNNEKKAIDKCNELLAEFYPKENPVRRSSTKKFKLKKQLSCCELPIINPVIPQRNNNDDDKHLERLPSISSNDSVKIAQSEKSDISDFEVINLDPKRRYSGHEEEQKHFRKCSQKKIDKSPLSKSGFFVPSVKNDINILKSGYIKFDSSIFKPQGKCLAKCDEFELVC